MTIYDFIYCEGALTAETIFYKVRVGSSIRDAAALSFVRGVACSSSDFLFSVHNLALAEFIDACACSLFGPSVFASRFLRVRSVSVCELAYMLEHLPWSFLNSTSVLTPVDGRAMREARLHRTANYPMNKNLSK